MTEYENINNIFAYHINKNYEIIPEQTNDN